MMDYARSIDASPNTLIAAMMYKAVSRFFENKEVTFISGRIAADYRDDMLEVNALKDKFCINFQIIDKNRKPLEYFLSILDEEGIPYRVSDIKTRYLPKIKLP